MMKAAEIVTLAALLAVTGPPATADDLVIDGTEMVISNDTVVDGSVWVENGGTLTIRNARLTLQLDYDEEHHIDVSGSSRLVIDNAQVDSTGGQFWFELSGDDGGDPRMEVSGDDTWLTNHSGIRPFDSAQIVVTGGDVEELQVRDQVTVELSDAAAYPVFFFDHDTATINGLDTGEQVSNTISTNGGWSMTLTDAWIEGYQIDLMNGADVTLSDGDGIVLSVHTPGNLGANQMVVEGITSDEPISGSLTNLGSRFSFTNSNIALINVYVFGTDRVLLRDLHVNEVNAEQQSELIIGQPGYLTELNCNLCQVYDHATFIVDSAVINAEDNLPSASSSYHNLEDEGYGVMIFRNMDLSQLDLTVLEHGTLLLHNCSYDDNRLEVIDQTTTTFGSYSLEVDFSASPLSGPSPLAVSFTDLSDLRLGDQPSDDMVWRWSFDDPPVGSIEQHPIRIFTKPDSYTITLTVSSPAGSSSEQKIDYLSVSEPVVDACEGEPVFIAAAAHADGDAGSVWRSDFSVYNPTGEPATIGMILFQPRSPGAGVVMGCFPATVAASASILFEDVVLTSFGGRSNAGAIGVYSDISPLVVMSRTYNQGDQGTFGQTIPGRTADQAIPENARAVLVQLHENGIYRSNIGAFNTTDSSAVVTIDLYTSQGTHLGNHRINLGPYDWEQVNRIFSKVTSDPVTNGRAEITLSGGPVLVYASVVDELTSDPSYIEPQILVGS